MKPATAVWWINLLRTFKWAVSIMIKHKATPRYAKALFDLSLKMNVLDAVHSDMLSLETAIKVSAKFTNFLQDRELTVKTQDSILNELFKGKIDPLTHRFILFLSKKKRLELLKQICEAFATLYQRHKNIVNLTIVSAHALAADQVRALTERMKVKLQKDVHTTQAVDPQLIGGFKLLINDNVSDFSLQALLEKFKNSIIFSY